VIVTDGEVEIRYVMPTDHASEQVRFCHLRLDYRAGSPGRQRAHTMYAGVGGGAKVGQWSGAMAALRAERNPAIG
jgi:hypothetical protein